MKKKKIMLAVVMIVFITVLTAEAVTIPVSIYDVQYTTDASGNSPYAGQTVDCAGGIVINKWLGGWTKLTLYDPANPDGWGGIIAKAPAADFADIQVGDWVSFSDFLVEESSGNTQLSYEDGAGLSIESTGNAIPDALDITASSFSEQYESMMVKVSDVEITAMNLGKYEDNYNLHNTNGDYWAGDYMNVDAAGLYHPYVAVGAVFESVSGIIEHKASSGWDYYQMLTTCTGDFVVPEPTTMAFLAAGAIAVFRRRNRQ
ncbi:MAG: PEP-CTERM sorting domain-containing protein [Sedimentisphaerales bacterium]|nr:PEP-CTERM sorting domain-containing protein [Sedimentisphaerales bacterium]